MLLFYDGTQRSAMTVASDVVANLHSKREVLRQMRSLVDQAVSLLNGDGDLNDFGRLLHENWRLKCKQSKLVTNPVIDGIYQTAIEHGVLGGKLLGAGASGFMIFYVPPGKQSQVIEGLSNYLHVPFKFETEGSMVIYDDVDRV